MQNRAAKWVTSDPYTTLGVSPDADPETIKRAWRTLAKTLHPDVTADDPHALAHYHAAQDAYHRLTKHKSSIHALQKRAEAAAQDIVKNRTLISPKRQPVRGADIEMVLRLSLEDWLTGGDRTVQLPNGRKVLVHLNPAWAAGHIVRLRAMGHPGKHGGMTGDALLTITPTPHQLFRQDGADLHALMPISLSDLGDGKTITVPTPRGTKTVHLPQSARAGTRIRLKGQGLPHKDGVGDLYLTLKLVSAEKNPFSDALGRFWQNWAGKSGDELKDRFTRAA